MDRGIRTERSPEGDHLMFSTDAVVFGRHVFPVEHPEWQRVGTLGASPIIAFSRTPLEASFDVGMPEMLTGCVAATPPANTHYVRSPRSRGGHHVVWCRFQNPGELGAIASRHDRSAAERSEAPMGRCTTPAPPLAAHAAHTIGERLARGEPVDPLELDETVVQISEIVASAAQRVPPRRTPTPGGRALRQRQDAVNRACEVMAVRFDESLSLSDLAAETGYSAAFLSRCFREATGLTMHEYLTSIRLVEALAMLIDSPRSIAQVALRTGFSSHAHLCSTFSHRLGLSPGAAMTAGRGRVLELLKLAGPHSRAR